MERSKKRNLSFNIRHNNCYPKELYMFDGDGILFDQNGNPVAWLETKFGDMGNEPIDLNTYQVLCFRNSCKLAKGTIPLFLVYYYTFDKNMQRLQSDDNDKECTYAQYFIVAGNEEAKTWFPEPTELTERQYVEFEFKLRGYLASYYHHKIQQFSDVLMKKVMLPYLP